MPTLSALLPTPLVGAAVRAVFALPRPVRRLLAGRPIRKDNQELALEAQLLLRLQRLEEADLSGVSPESARASILWASALIAAGSLRPVGTRDLTIPTEDGELPARLYTPGNLPAGSPLLVYYHGGGWVIGDLQTHDDLCRYLALNGQVRVLSVDYRLAPEHPFPAGIDDALASFRWAVANAASLGADAEAVAVGGDSAGGNLAAVVAQVTSSTGLPKPVYALLFYPAVDLTTRRRSRALFADGFYLTDADMDWFQGHYIQPGQVADPRASVLLAKDLTGFPPTYLGVAGFDPLRDEGELFARRLHEAGVPVVLRRHADLIHGYASMFALGGRFVEALSEATGALRAGIAMGRTDAARDTSQTA